VPAVTLSFWLIKILATTLGETGGDAVSMSLNLGYLVASIIFLIFFGVTLLIQVAGRHYRPFAYWSVVVATTTVGTTVSDFLDRTMGLGYVKSSIVLFAITIGLLIVWRMVTGRIKYEHVVGKTDEIFYWFTILTANTLGTALGDCVADDVGLGFEWGAVFFAGLILIVALSYTRWRIWPASIYFWTAYILTRPLGATVGDTLTKDYELGGLQLSRIISSLVILAIIVSLVMIVNWKHLVRGGQLQQISGSE
jgi:uncharacterized membrane-anchored protein